MTVFKLQNIFFSLTDHTICVRAQEESRNVDKEQSIQQKQSSSNGTTRTNLIHVACHKHEYDNGSKKNT